MAMTMHWPLGQPALKVLGPDAADRFRFTWWNTQIGDAVWLEHRGAWRAGMVTSRGRKYVQVTMADVGIHQTRVTRPYSQLRRRR